MNYRKSFLALVACFLIPLHATNDCPFINEDGTIEEGFVTFATHSYFGLLRVCIESVHKFSTRPIVVYGIFYDVPFSQEEFPRMIKRRMEITPLTYFNIYLHKTRIMVNSGIKYGVYIEADDIANQGIDNLFALAHEVKDVPLCPIHQDGDPGNQGNIMELLGVTKKTMPYVHAHVIFSHKCFDFLDEWHAACKEYGPQAATYDETILNVLLWKKGATRYAPFYDPSHLYLESYFKGTLEQDCLQNRGKAYPYMIHGCKDPDRAQEILNRLVAHSKQHSN